LTLQASRLARLGVEHRCARDAMLQPVILEWCTP
jgi:hypothetical protein